MIEAEFNAKVLAHIRKLTVFSGGQLILKISLNLIINTLPWRMCCE